MMAMAQSAQQDCAKPDDFTKSSIRHASYLDLVKRVNLESATGVPAPLPPDNPFAAWDRSAAKVLAEQQMESSAPARQRNLLLPGPHGTSPLGTVRSHSAFVTDASRAGPADMKHADKVPSDSIDAIAATAAADISGRLALEGQSRPSNSPLTSMRSALCSAASLHPSAAASSMPDLSVLLRRSASMPHHSGTAATRSLASHAREARAESILELWDLGRAQERTAQRDAAASQAEQQSNQVHSCLLDAPVLRPACNHIIDGAPLICFVTGQASERCKNTKVF